MKNRNISCIIIAIPLVLFISFAIIKIYQFEKLQVFEWDGEKIVSSGVT